MGTSSDGAGALPGTLSEVSVAKLPEERRLEGLGTASAYHRFLFIHHSAFSLSKGCREFWRLLCSRTGVVTKGNFLVDAKYVFLRFSRHQVV